MYVINGLINEPTWVDDITGIRTQGSVLFNKDFFYLLDKGEIVRITKDLLREKSYNTRRRIKERMIEIMEAFLSEHELCMFTIDDAKEIVEEMIEFDESTFNTISNMIGTVLVVEDEQLKETKLSEIFIFDKHKFFYADNDVWYIKSAYEIKSLVKHPELADNIEAKELLSLLRKHKISNYPNIEDVKVLAKREKLIEYFTSWQGEGLHLGKRAFFIRFKKCNLKCPFCDTMSKMQDPNIIAPFDLTTKTIDEFLQNDGRLIVVTGGEPLLYTKELENLLDYLERCQFDGKVVIETNGVMLKTTKVINLLNKYPKLISLSISSKIFVYAEDSPYTEFFEIQESFNELKDEIKENSIFKFVVSREDHDKFKELLKEIKRNYNFRIPMDKVYLMPMGESQTEVLLNTPVCFKLAHETGCNVTTRLHILGLVP